MPYFTFIGRYDKNLSGNTSQGYFISRSAKAVTVKFGAVHVVNRKYYWGGRKLPMVKVRKFKTIEEAKWLYNDRVRRRLKTGFSKLRSDCRIFSNIKMK
jgi:hypothetical protein